MSDPVSQKRLLVVDDDMSYRMLLAKFLRDGGFIVDLAANGEQAMQRMQKESYDAALVDNLMPGLSGLDLVKWMQTNYASIPTIILTGYSSNEIKENFSNLQVAAYISKKDFEISTLVSTIQSLLK